MSTTKKELLKVIHEKCMDCTFGQIKEVRLCPAEHCPLWQFRMGKDPDKRPLSEAERKARIAALQKAWKAKNNHG